MHELGFDHAHMTPEEEKPLAEAIWTADNVELTTVGVDIGSSTSHLMFAKVHLQRLSTALSSRFVVVGREILWRSPILLTPYSDTATIDVKQLEAFIEGAYKSAGLGHDDVDSGAVILTRGDLKRDDADAIAHRFAAESGKVVVGAAGHELNSAHAATGCGAARALGVCGLYPLFPSRSYHLGRGGPFLVLYPVRHAGARQEVRREPVGRGRDDARVVGALSGAAPHPRDLAAGPLSARE